MVSARQVIAGMSRSSCVLVGRCLSNVYVGYLFKSCLPPLGLNADDVPTLHGTKNMVAEQHETAPRRRRKPSCGPQRMTQHLGSGGLLTERARRQPLCHDPARSQVPRRLSGLLIHAQTARAFVKPNDRRAHLLPWQNLQNAAVCTSASSVGSRLCRRGKPALEDGAKRLAVNTCEAVKSANERAILRDAVEMVARRERLAIKGRAMALGQAGAASVPHCKSQD